MSKSPEIPAVPAAHLNNALMQGFLDKKRPSKKLLSIKYQRRWCIVYGKFFLYYDTPESKVQNGCISLDGYKFLPSPGIGEFGFSLVHKSKHKRSFEFMTHTKAEFDQWKTAIQKGIALTAGSNAPLVPIKRTSSRPKDKCSTLPNTRAITPTNETYKTTTLPNNSRQHQAIYNLSTTPRDASPKPNGERKKLENNLYAKPMKHNGASPKLPPRFPRDNNSSGNIYKSKDRKSNGESTESESEPDDKTSEADGDDDNYGYIKPEKLNQFKIPTKCATTEPEITYTADDYMTVLPDSLPNATQSTKGKNRKKSRQSSREGDDLDSDNKQEVDVDYMTVLPNLPKDESLGDNDKISYKSKEKLYSSVKRGNDSSPDKPIEKIYSSVKKPGRGVLLRSESDYASVETLLPSRKNDDYSSDDEDECDYENPEDIVLYSKLSNLPDSTAKSSEDSGSSAESTDEEDYLELDEYEKVEDFQVGITKDKSQVTLNMSRQTFDSDSSYSEPDPIYANTALS